MQRLSTLFYLVNEFEKVTGELEDWEMKMEECDYKKDAAANCLSGPSAESVQAILDFAQSYHYEKSRTLDGIDMYLN